MRATLRAFWKNCFVSLRSRFELKVESFLEIIVSNCEASKARDDNILLIIRISCLSLFQICVLRSTRRNGSTTSGHCCANKKVLHLLSKRRSQTCLSVVTMANLLLKCIFRVCSELNRRSSALRPSILRNIWTRSRRWIEGLTPKPRESFRTFIIVSSLIFRRNKPWVDRQAKKNRNWR